ncbi:MAG: hypothetical protein H6865_03055 [Rhodospirillales bacterium]|nr:hypothetical protein [Alphaproteobacteria bacterium]MCB9986596.1 hypothetical protein [Rhodospirillales bacterium]USO06874.1 MAG: hypothetical protein H6866_05330 [Rhodospirillales bacterium]
MTFLARLYDEETGRFRVIAPGEVSRAFARANHIVCPHTGCNAEMRPIGAAMAEGHTVLRRTHFNTKDHETHAPDCPEGGRTKTLQTIKSLCGALEGGIPILLNLNFDTGLNLKKPVSDETRSVGTSWLGACMPFAVWVKDQYAHQHDRPQAYVSAAMHDTSEVMQTIDKIAKYGDGTGLGHVWVRTGDTVQRLSYFALYDNTDAIKQMVRMMAERYDPRFATVQAAPKLVYFAPAREQDKMGFGRLKSVRGRQISSLLPVAHHYNLHVHLPRDTARARFTEHGGRSTVIARPYLWAEDARRLNDAFRTGEGLSGNYPVKLFFQVVEDAQFIPIDRVPDAQLAFNFAAQADRQPRLAAKRVEPDWVRRGPRAP